MVGQTALELVPLLALIEGDPQAELGAGEQHLRLHVILDQRVGDLTVGHIAADRLPAAPAIPADRDVRVEVPLLLVVEGGVDHLVIVERRLDVADVGVLGHPRDLVYRTPLGVPFLDVDQAVVGADVDQPLDQRRLAERDDVAVVGGGLVLVDRVHLPQPAHDLELIPIELTGEVAGDRRPAMAAIVGAVQPLAGEVEAGVGVGGDDQRRIPVPAVRRLTGRPPEAGCRRSPRSCGRNAPDRRTATGSRRCSGSPDRPGSRSRRRRR